MSFLHTCYTWLDKVLTPQLEEKQMASFVQGLRLTPDMRILDVGCGYGRNMKLLQDVTAARIEGVDINPHIVEENRKAGLRCRTVEEFMSDMEGQNVPCYDCMIFSHVIEHFMPEDLKRFLDGYLRFLKPGGYVVFVTPLLWKGFYWDFDHIKMYHPIGMNMVFGEKTAQVQYYGETQLRLIDIWFRRDAHRVHYHRGLYVTSAATKWWMLANLFYRFLFKISFGWIGITNGWMGLYQKVK